MFYSDLNVDDLESVFIDNLDDLEILIDNRFSKLLINDFNNRVINGNNINEIINLCNHLLIDNTWRYVTLNMEPGSKYELNTIHLPNNINNISINEMAQYGLLKFLINASSFKLPSL